jgi:hypothetical protein
VEEGLVPASCTGCLATQAENAKASAGRIAACGAAGCSCRRCVQQVQDNLFLAVGGQIECYLLCRGTLAANPDRNLFSPGSWGAAVNGDLFGAATAASPLTMLL